MRPFFALLSILFFCFEPLVAKAALKPAPAEPVAAPKLLTRVVGEISDRSITSREVQINDALEQAINGAKPDALRVLSGRESEFSLEVTRVLHEWAVFLEAGAFAQKPIPKSEVLKTLKSALELWSARAEWKKLEASESELQSQLERKLLAREFVALKSEASQAPVTDADALAYFKKNRLKFGNLPFEDFRDNIKKFLARQQTDRRLKEWYEVLDRKYRARNFISG